MKHSVLFLFVCLFILGWLQPIKGSGQTLPPDQPEQDACNALQICGNFTTPYSYNGEGLTVDLTTTPCASPEKNSVWFRLDVTSPGIIVFKIVPFDTLDDYDFAIVDITNGDCSNIQQSEVIRCNFNNNEQPNTYYSGGIVGLNTTSALTSVAGGTYGEPFLQEISASVGDEYLIMINNFGHDDCSGSCPGSGFTLDFTGTTAGFNQPPAPQLGSVLPACDYSNSVTIQLTQNALCSSIASDGSDFYLTPSGTIQSAQGVACSGSLGYTQKVTLNFSSQLPNGNYVVHAKTGTDNNTILGLCAAELQLPDSLNFHVGNDPLQMLSIDSPACQTLIVNINSPVKCSTIAADGSDFKVSGPSLVSVDAASGENCTATGYTQTIAVHLAQPIAVDGEYKLVAQIGTDGNTVVDSCGRVVPQGAYAIFYVNSFNGLLEAGPDTSTCQNSINLYAANHGVPASGGFQYTWTPSSAVQNPHSANTEAPLSPGYHAFVLSTIDSNGCYLRDSVVIKMIPFVGAVNPVEERVCEGKPIPLVASGGVQYKWSDNALITGTPSELSCSDCADPYATLPVGDHTFYVKITNDVYCTDTLTSLIHVLQNPVVTSFPADTTIKYGDGITLTALGALNYFWNPVVSLNDPMSSDPWATPKENTAYIVIGADENGCTGSDTSFVQINYRSQVFIPNAFSPNGDGLNDVFKIAHITDQRILTFNIYDRWGNLVFQTNNPNEGWDGTYNGKPASQDVYQYYIKLGYPDNYQETFKGSVNLIR